MEPLHIRANFTREEIAAACVQYGPQVGPLPGNVDGVKLLWAISGVESSFGADCQPRHEPAFDVGGRYATHYPMPQLIELYGSSAACSYGPWQLLLCNAPLTAGPALFDQLMLAATYTLAFLNSKLRQSHPQSLAEIGECWNAGRITPDPAYVSKLLVNYIVAMPQS